MKPSYILIVAIKWQWLIKAGLDTKGLILLYGDKILLWNFMTPVCRLTKWTGTQMKYTPLKGYKLLSVSP